jgi:O-acetyl-ADP-ribose deacetylase (regulator of RNase III)
MIEFKSGNILREDAEALVNTVNCVGIMGRGVALQFKNAFRENFKAYAVACKRGDVQPGRMFIHETGWLANPKFIINFPTKRHWKGKSRIEDIDAGLASLVNEIRKRGIRSIALPPLGAGLGGLDWSVVRRHIEAALGALEQVRVTVFEPHVAADASDVVPVRSHRADKVPDMTAGRAALVGLMHRYLGGLMDPFVTLLEVHKLMYFMQVAGEPLRLRYKAAIYGPYAENLRHVLRKIDGYFVAGYSDGGDTPDKELTLVPGAVEDAERSLMGHEGTRERFERVARLVQGFETRFGLELLSTVHWVAHRAESRDPARVMAGTYAWNERKRQFSERQIRLALDVLGSKGWLTNSEPAVAT